jgi:hypothetical protein
MNHHLNDIQNIVFTGKELTKFESFSFYEFQKQEVGYGKNINTDIKLQDPADPEVISKAALVQLESQFHGRFGASPSALSKNSVSIKN